jgi:hypothetical protein
MTYRRNYGIVRTIKGVILIGLAALTLLSLKQDIPDYKLYEAQKTIVVKTVQTSYIDDFVKEETKDEKTDERIDTTVKKANVVSIITDYNDVIARMKEDVEKGQFGDADYKKFKENIRKDSLDVAAIRAIAYLKANNFKVPEEMGNPYDFLMNMSKIEGSGKINAKPLDGTEGSLYGPVQWKKESFQKEVPKIAEKNRITDFDFLDPNNPYQAYVAALICSSNSIKKAEGYDLNKKHIALLAHCGGEGLVNKFVESGGDYSILSKPAMEYLSKFDEMESDQATQDAILTLEAELNNLYRQEIKLADAYNNKTNSQFSVLYYNNPS